MPPILPDLPPGRTVRRIEPIGLNWGATPEDRAHSFPCDGYLPDAHDACFRAVTVDAPAPVVYRRLCQLQLAPYSYDWIDNWGRRSPQELVPGAEHLEAGQRILSFFELVDFESETHVTMVLVRLRRILGEVALTYLVVPEAVDRTRLVVKLLVKHPGPRFLRPVVRWVGPLGDLVMMRRQLLNFKQLAERDAARLTRA